MGTNLKSILTTKEISLENLSGKTFAIDSFNILYQFLTTIRQYDGSYLTDENGNITSHLSGLFFRTVKLMKNNLKLIFVFDGKAPDLKIKERERRKALKLDAQRKYDLAVEQGDIEMMKKYASRTTRLTTEQIIEAKELITALGLPIVQAPSEGEAQAAYMVKNDDAYAIISQDTDGLLFGGLRLIKNLSITRKKKKGAIYVKTEPEVINLTENLNKLGIDQDQLIILGMLNGTDFNIGGIKGIGPKKGLILVKKYKKDFDSLFKEVNWDFSFSWKEVFNLIKNMPVKQEYNLEWKTPDKQKLMKILVEEHDFSRERVEKAIDDLIKTKAQKGLSEFF